jgi:hypothetical protein
VPLCDHLTAYALKINSTDWGCMLPALHLAQANRIPRFGGPPDVMEITLGESSEEDINRAIAFVEERSKATAATFGSCLLAADVECMSVPKSDWDGAGHFPPLSNCVFRSSQSKEKSYQLAVKFMVGHLGWELDIRLPISTSRLSDSSNEHIISAGRLQANIHTLTESLGTLCGVGIAKDIEAFNEAVTVLFGEPLQFQKSVDLQVICRLAGYNMKRYAVEAL